MFERLVPPPPHFLGWGVNFPKAAKKNWPPFFFFFFIIPYGVKKFFFKKEKRKGGSFLVIRPSRKKKGLFLKNPVKNCLRAPFFSSQDPPPHPPQT